MAFTSATPKRLFAPLTVTIGSQTTIYTAPAVTTTLPSRLDFVNLANTPTTFDLFLVPSGGSAGTTNQLLSKEGVNPNDRLPLDMRGIAMNTGDFLVVQPYTNSLTIHGSGAECA